MGAPIGALQVENQPSKVQNWYNGCGGKAKLPPFPQTGGNNPLALLCRGLVALIGSQGETMGADAPSNFSKGLVAETVVNQIRQSKMYTLSFGALL